MSVLSRQPQRQEQPFSLSGEDAHYFTFNASTAELSASLPSDRYLDAADRNGVYQLEVSLLMI